MRLRQDASHSLRNKMQRGSIGKSLCPPHLVSQTGKLRQECEVPAIEPGGLHGGGGA